MRTLVIDYTTKEINVRVSHAHLRANFISEFGEIRMQSTCGSLYI